MGLTVDSEDIHRVICLASFIKMKYKPIAKKQAGLPAAECVYNDPITGKALLSSDSTTTKNMELENNFLLHSICVIPALRLALGKPDN